MFNLSVHCLDYIGVLSFLPKVSFIHQLFIHLVLYSRLWGQVLKSMVNNTRSYLQGNLFVPDQPFNFQVSLSLLQSVGPQSTFSHLPNQWTFSNLYPCGQCKYDSLNRGETKCSTRLFSDTINQISVGKSYQVISSPSLWELSKTAPCIMPHYFSTTLSCLIVNNYK